jgi:hypothetical protein
MRSLVAHAIGGNPFPATQHVNQLSVSVLAV